MQIKGNRITSIDMLRGIAALSVCIFHFTNGNPSYFSNSYWLKQMGSVGWAGVEIFFVISGFVIPYSLHNAKYRINDFGSFLLKRTTRIEPPYFVSILIIILLGYISMMSPYFKGQPFQINYLNLLLHFFYLNDFFHRAWFNPVFWTLAIEFQFYLLIGLIFPLIVHRKFWVFVLSIVLLFAVGLYANSEITIFHYISYFILGILIFKRKVKKVHVKFLFALELLVLLGIYWQFTFVPFVAAFLAWAVLSFFQNWQNQWLLWMGTISYSFYLIHVPLGGRMVNLSANFFTSDMSRSFVLAFILLITIGASYVFHRFIEKPVIKFSQKQFLQSHKKNAS